MKRTAAALALLVSVSDQTPLRADFPRLGIFRKKKDDTPPANPQPAAPQPATPPAKASASVGLIQTLRADKDEKKRIAAAESLAGFDTRTHTDVIPGLIGALQQDPSANVRSTVAESLGKLKPINQEAGAVLEQAVAADPSEAVRKSAQQALWQYHLNGYRASAGVHLPETAEPPLAKPKTATKSTPQVVGIPTSGAKSTPDLSAVKPVPVTTGIGRGAIYPQTVEPPLAKTSAKASPKPTPVPIKVPTQVPAKTTPQPVALPPEEVPTSKPEKAPAAEPVDVVPPTPTTPRLDAVPMIPQIAPILMVPSVPAVPVVPSVPPPQ